MLEALRRALILCILVSVAASCGQPDPVEPANTQPFDSTRTALNVAFGSVAQEGQKLTHRSATPDLLANKQRATELQNKLSDLPDRTEAENLRLEALRQQVLWLDSALNVQQVRKEWEGLFASGTLPRGWVNRSVQEKRGYLRENWPAFRQVDDKLIAAERSYKEMSNKMAAAFKAGQDATAQPPSSS